MVRTTTSILLMAAAMLGSTYAAVRQLPLPYPMNALEPFLSAETVKSHYELHGRYVQRTNQIIKGTLLDKAPLSVIVLTAPYKSELYNQSLQSQNHNLQWQLLAPPPLGGGEPKGSLGVAIKKQFGGLEGLKKAFIEESYKVFASGYVTLVKEDHSGDLKVIANGDADNPLRLGQGVPVLPIDLWEHAYYLDVRYERVKYLMNTFQIVNWHQANKIYEGDLTPILGQ